MRITGERDFIVVDLDGTLCDVSERVGYAVCKDWDGFHDRIPYDPPRHDVAEFLQFVGGHCPWPPVYTVIAVTGRPERYRAVTYDWLERQTCVR